MNDGKKEDKKRLEYKDLLIDNHSFDIMLVEMLAKDKKVK